MKPTKIAIEPAQTYWSNMDNGCLTCTLAVPTGSRVLGFYENNLLIERGVFLIKTEKETLRFIAIPAGVEVEADDPEGKLERGAYIGPIVLGKNLIPYCVFQVVERAN